MFKRFSDGSEYNGELYENKMDGKGKLEYKDGSIYEGNFL